MIIVGDVEESIKSVLGTCSDEQFFDRINEAQEQLTQLANWDPLTISLDICTQGCEITLPDDIEVPLAMNVGGKPADFRNKWFEYHMNGPGSECCAGSCDSSWQDLGNFPTFRDPIEPSIIAAYPEADEPMGSNVRVYGFDEVCGLEKWIMTPDCNGVLQDGFDVPILFGMGSGMTVNQKVKRITRISKPITNSFIKIVALDPGACSGGTLLGIIRPNITEPSFRRIKISGSGTQFLTGSTEVCSTWVRMRARKKTFKVTSRTDAIPLNSLTALKMMAMAIKKYEADLIGEYKEYFNMAREALMREQKIRSGPNQIKIQFQGAWGAGRCDNLI